MRNIVAYSVLILATTTGCGGEAESKGYADLDALASAAGCEGFTAEPQPQMFTESGGECVVDGTTYYVYWFADTDNRDRWVQTAKTMAGGSYLVGDSWTVDGAGASLEAIKSNVGGEVE